ncbi:hypothetical protein FJTKL_11188 [Diaporthe vaccinii]|uniref:Uncharacterized protein n=1 Tax=Diaporthe vaccinii TaxID=105482 RepID=A0ABR4EIB6_9PEZI
MEYLRQTCHELTILSDDKLQTALSQTALSQTKPSCELGNKHRRQGMTDSDTDPSGAPAKYVKLNETHVAQPARYVEGYSSELDSHFSLSDALSAQSATQPPLAMVPSGNAAGPVALESHPSISSQMVYTDTLEGQESFNPRFDAPLLGVLNFVPCYADDQQMAQTIGEGL